MSDLIKDFNEYRQRLNTRVMDSDNLVLKRLFSLDTQTYQSGAIDQKTKEMIGLSASMVLRCDDCVKYHLQKCFELGITRQEVFEVFAISNIIGGTIVIPHLRRAIEFWDALEKQKNIL
jgi:AhpD family alkylhydroperoxidase